MEKDLLKKICENEMVRRVFFSFHYERDIWRANVVRYSFAVMFKNYLQNFKRLLTR